MDPKELYRKAVETMPKAYAPFSNFTVGAALLTRDGRVITGVNVENSSLWATICAERTAFVKAISEGERDFEAIAVCCNDVTAWPCVICRQFMLEFGEDLTVIAGPDEDNLTVTTLKELLPHGFRLEKGEL